MSSRRSKEMVIDDISRQEGRNVGVVVKTVTYLHIMISFLVRVLSSVYKRSYEDSTTLDISVD